MGVPVTITDKGVPVSIQGDIPASAIPMGSPGDPAGPLGPDGRIPSSQLPPLEHDIARAATEAEMLALAVTSPAICIRTDFTPPHVFYLVADPGTNLANWEDTGEFGANTANPSVTVGLTAKNGTAATVMRSDAAPAIDQAIAPTWTGVHTFTNDVVGQTHVAATNHAASTPAALGSSVQMFTSNNVSTVAHVNSLNSANNRIAYSQWDNSATYTIAGFANDAFSSFVSALKVVGGQNVGITGMESSSGSGQWLHSGAFQANGTITANTFNGNGIVQSGSALSGVPSISTMGGDTNVSLLITTKGAGGITLDRNTNVVGAFTVNGKSVAPIVASDGRAAQSANINAPTLYAVPTSGLYRVSTYIVVTQAATTSSTMPSVSVNYTEATSGAAVQDMVTNTATLNLLGAHIGGTAVISAQQGSNIGYITAGYASSGATPMQYAVHIKIEFLG